ELRVILEPDERVLTDVRLLLKTDKYIKRKQTSSTTASEKRILESKAALNREREKELVQRIQVAIGKSELVVNAADVPASSSDALGRITEGFQELVGRTYTLLKQLGGVAYSEQQVAGAADPESGLFDANAWSKLHEPAEEVLSAIIRKDTLGEQVTMKSLVDTFQAKPYGWDLPAIEVVVASLAGRSKVTLTMDGNSLKRSEIAGALRNTQKHGHLVVTLQKSFDETKVASFRSFCTDFFDEGATPKDPLELARHGADRLRGKLDELKATVSSSKYPFVSHLQGAIDLLEQVVGKPDEWYLGEFDLAADLLDAKENDIDPIQAFLSGPQRVIYDDASSLLTTHASNLGYLPSGSDAEIRKLLDDPNCFRGAKMAHLKNAIDELRVAIDALVGDKRSEVVRTLDERRAELVATPDYAAATPDAQELVASRIDQTIEKVASEKLIAHILQIESAFLASDYPMLLDQLATSRDPGSEKTEPAKQTVSIKTISIPSAGGLLEGPEDVESYVDALRVALMQVLNDNKRISL
ncbi:MAG: BREX system P-loop protein BrxC, partial [Thermoleophilia bacterium]|nr:BREX system P-loop protein BrxC [Thermoleophilia bacterium]